MAMRLMQGFPSLATRARFRRCLRPQLSAVLRTALTSQTLLWLSEAGDEPIEDHEDECRGRGDGEHEFAGAIDGWRAANPSDK